MEISSMTPKVGIRNRIEQPVGLDTLNLAVPLTGPDLMDQFELKLAHPSTMKGRICYTESTLRGIRAKSDDKKPWYGEADARGIRDMTTIPCRSARHNLLDVMNGQGRREVKSKRGKLQGSRPDCLQCGRLAFWELDLSAPCLTTEAEMWDVPTKEDEHTAKKKIRAGKTISKNHVLGDIELQVLQAFPPDTRSFCVGNRVSMAIMNSMLARHGRQSHNPLIRQYDERSQNQYAGTRTPEYDSNDIDRSERSDKRSSVSSETRGRDGDTPRKEIDTSQRQTPSEFHENIQPSPTPVRTARLLSFRDPRHSPKRFMIGPQRKPLPAAFAKSSPNTDRDDEREPFPSRAQARNFRVELAGAKRKGSCEHDDSRESHDEQIICPASSAKKVKIENDEEPIDSDDSTLDHVPGVNREYYQPPIEGWVSDVLEDMLQMEMSARPDSPREVGLAIKKELEVLLIEDIVYGDPEDGRPVYIPLLRALNAALESEG